MGKGRALVVTTSARAVGLSDADRPPEMHDVYTIWRLWLSRKRALDRARQHHVAQSPTATVRCSRLPGISRWIASGITLMLDSDCRLTETFTCAFCCFGQ